MPDVRSPSSQHRNVFSQNDPYDRNAPIQFVIPKLVDSREYMESIRQHQVPPNALTIWYLGQNGFILKDSAGPLVGIDLYLTNGCATRFAHLPYRLDRQLPVFIEPEDLDVDVFITTHSHEDHADPETIRRMRKTSTTKFIGPFDSIQVYQSCGVDQSCCRLIHPGESVELAPSTFAQATFAVPTDTTDLNHTGILLRFPSGLTFLNTGDTAYAECLKSLLPTDIDICAICINGGFNNLSVTEATALVKALKPQTVIPCHYDMMINNIASPKMLKVAMDLKGIDAQYVEMKYYQPWTYKRN